VLLCNDRDYIIVVLIFPKQDAKLREGMELYRGQGIGGAIHWGKVSEHMGGRRTSQQCSHRWNKTLKPKLVQAWTEAEDLRLWEGVETCGAKGDGRGIDWARVSAHMGGLRSAKQCAHRWNSTMVDKTVDIL